MSIQPMLLNPLEQVSSFRLHSTTRNRDTRTSNKAISLESTRIRPAKKKAVTLKRNHDLKTSNAEYSQHVNFPTIHSQVFHSNAIYAGLHVTGIIVEQISTVSLEAGLVTSERGFFAADI